MITEVSDQERWWLVIGYEVKMLRALTTRGSPINVASADPQQTMWLLNNLMTEGKALHTRNLCDFCTSAKPTDIKPSDVFNNYYTDQKYTRLRNLIEDLKQQYGKGDEENSARWVFNKMLAHPTKERGTSFEYGPHLTRIWLTLWKIIDELEALRRQSFE